ncbi:MAG: HIT family protein [Gemmatimonadota bacterium]|jgi:diadenosine tetraphosphate (Ap4A) HIT family hydrolase|nr:HIT family protein [Gemmatimonadota bacterium]MDP6803695.1 HIT family protein [Gemmatimonadota bacterium]
MSCLFCALDQDRVLAENSVGIAIRDAYPVSRGHTLIVAKRHVASWFDATAEERSGLMKLLGGEKARLDQEMSPAAYNIGINAGRVAGQTIDHLHIHLIPRYPGDVPDPTGGVRNIIPGQGRYSPG